MSSQKESAAVFTRRRLLLQGEKPEIYPERSKQAPVLVDDECKVLVINSSQDMAKEITMQLTLKLPGCSITYAPSIEMAKWILRRRNFHLVVSSPLLPDGSFSNLNSVLRSLKEPPDLVVVGDVNVPNTELFGNSGYELTALRRFGKTTQAAAAPRSRQIPLLKDRIKSLGADIRNDLNNPLQEIVAMVFVAQAGMDRSPTRDKALEAIDTAAKNMARLVNTLENKILDVVSPSS